MTILMTISINLADPVTLAELRKFLDITEQNCADPDMDLREYDENNDLVGLAAVGELGSGDSDGDTAEASEDDEEAQSDEDGEAVQSGEDDEEVQSGEEPCS